MRKHRNLSGFQEAMRGATVLQELENDQFVLVLQLLVRPESDEEFIAGVLECAPKSWAKLSPSTIDNLSSNW